MMPEETHNCPMEHLADGDLPVVYALIELLAERSRLSVALIASLVHEFCHILAECREDTECIALFEEDIAEQGSILGVIQGVVTSLRAQKVAPSPAPGAERRFHD